MSNRYAWLRAPLVPGDDAGWRWLARDSGGVVTGSPEEFVAGLVPASRVLLLLPVTQALVVPVNLPQKQQRQLLAALPFLLEEALAADIERFHVVSGERLDAQNLQVLAVERDALQALITRLQAAGVDPDIVTPDALALPARGTVLLDGGHSLLRSADGGAMAFDMHDAVLLAGLVPDASNLQVLMGPAGSEAAAGALETALAMDDESRPPPADLVPRDLLERVASLGDAACARLPNLRQGGFARAGSTDFSLGFDWRPLAWLAASWAIIALGYQLAVGISHARAAEATRLAQVDLYKQLFPGSSNVPRPRQQMEGQLAGGQSADDRFVSLVARTAGTFVELGGAAAGFRPGSMAWDSGQRQLRLDVQARSLEDIDRLRAALQEKGLAVDIGAGVAQEGGYKARMNVGEGA